MEDNELMTVIQLRGSEGLGKDTEYGKREQVTDSKGIKKVESLRHSDGQETEIQEDGVVTDNKQVSDLTSQTSELAGPTSKKYE